MAYLYNEEFHEFLETYGELLDHVENTRDVLKAVQEEVSSQLDDLNAELEAAADLLQALEKQVWQFRTRADASKPIAREQKHMDHEDGSSFMPDIADAEDPFADVWKA